MSVNHLQHYCLLQLFSVVDIKCFGDSSGAIYVTAIGGTAPYTYAWSNGDTTQDASNLISNLPAGIYQVVVTDDNGCTKTVSRTLSKSAITQPLSPISVQTTITNVICKNGSTGNVTLTPSGGTAPSGAYSYLWSSGQTTQSINNLTWFLHVYSY